MKLKLYVLVFNPFLLSKMVIGDIIMMQGAHSKPRVRKVELASLIGLTEILSTMR